MDQIKKKLIKLIVSDSSEINSILIDELAQEFADILDIEGCVDKTAISFEKVWASSSEDTKISGALSNSILPYFLNQIITKALHIIIEKQQVK